MGAAAPKRGKREIKALIAGARRPERTVDICLRGDLAAEMAEAERAIINLEQQRGGDSLAGNPAARDLARRQEALREEMLAHTVQFRLRGVSRRRWTELLAQYPPREGNKADEAMGMNLDDCIEALVKECVVEPELDDDDWDHLLAEALTDGTYEMLTNAAWGVNQRDISVPFSHAASQILKNSGSGQRQPSGSESPSSGSTAGSQQPEPSTSTTPPAG